MVRMHTVNIVLLLRSRAFSREGSCSYLGVNAGKALNAECIHPVLAWWLQTSAVLASLLLVVQREAQAQHKSCTFIC